MENAQYGNDYGNAAPATERDLRRAKIISGGKGAFFGFYSRHALRQPSDAGIVVIGGAGSGKSACIFMMNELVDYQQCNSITFDPRAELTMVSTLAASLMNYEQFSYKPDGYFKCSAAQHKPA